MKAGATPDAQGPPGHGVTEHGVTEQGVTDGWVTEHWVLETVMPSGEGAGVPLRLGAQSWGELSPEADNAILVCHYYTGTMRAAGQNPDGTPAWWDDLIGPGKALDTDRYFVICMNSLSNVQALDPEVVTTGPETPAPDGQPWGERFPKWGFEELHAAQLDLMHALGVPRWHAVVGPSFGGMQALHWAARSPDLAPRVAAVGTSPAAGLILRDVFGPLLADVSECSGLHGALRLITLFGFGSDGLAHLFAPGTLDPYLQSRSGHASLAHILDIGRVVQTHDLAGVAPCEELFSRWSCAGTRLLTVNVSADAFFPAHEMADFAAQSAAAGAQHTHLEFASGAGHMGCLTDTAAFAPALRELLESPAGLPMQPPPLQEDAHV